MHEINPSYLSAVADAKKAFLSNKELPSIKLQKFFSEKFYLLLKKQVSALKFKHYVDKMCYSYACADLPLELEEFLNSPLFLSFASSVVGTRVKAAEGSAYMMTWKDYALINDKSPEKPGIDFIIDFTNDFGCGGEVIYVDGTGSYSSIEMAENTLSIVMRRKNVHKFIHYLNHHAKNKKRLLVVGSLIV